MLHPQPVVGQAKNVKIGVICNKFYEINNNMNLL